MLPLLRTILAAKERGGNTAMDRRLILGAAAAAAPAALAAPALAQTQSPELRWRLASSFPKNLDILFGGAEYLARRVAQMTENRFQIRTFAAGEIVPALQVLDALQNGTIECGQTSSLYYIGKDPTLAAFAAIPWGLNMRQMTAWMRHGGGNELAAEIYRDYNVVGIPFGDTGTQMGGWFRKEIRSLDDLKGVKFRISGIAGHVFARLGAAPTQIAASDIYPSLERGTIDAAEWIGPYDDEKLGFQRVAKYYYAPGFWDGCSRGVFMMNQRAWDALPDLYKTHPRGRLRRGDAGDGRPLRRGEPEGAAPAAGGRRAVARLGRGRSCRPPGARRTSCTRTRRPRTRASARCGRATRPSGTSSSSGSGWRRTPTRTSPSRLRRSVEGGRTSVMVP